MVLDPLAVELIKRLLTQPGLSQRKIALQARVSRGSVALIKQGRWRPPTPRRDNPDLLVDPPTGPPSRCTTCGVKVYGTCHACRVRRFMRRTRRRFPDNGEQSTEPNTLELKPEHHARYLEVRRHEDPCNAN